MSYNLLTVANCGLDYHTAKNRLVLARITATSNFNYSVYAVQSKGIELPIGQDYNNYLPANTFAYAFLSGGALFRQP